MNWGILDFCIFNIKLHVILYYGTIIKRALIVEVVDVVNQSIITCTRCFALFDHVAFVFVIIIIVNKL